MRMYEFINDGLGVSMFIPAKRSDQAWRRLEKAVTVRLGNVGQFRLYKSVAIENNGTFVFISAPRNGVLMLLA